MSFDCIVQQVGREKVEAAGLSSRVELQLGDAQDLSDIPDGSIDKVRLPRLCAYQIPS